MITEGLGYHLKSGQNLTCTGMVRAIGPGQIDADRLGLARRRFSLGVTTNAAHFQAVRPSTIHPTLVLEKQ
jgi:hypothetical protein